MSGILMDGKISFKKGIEYGEREKQTKEAGLDGCFR